MGDHAAARGAVVEDNIRELVFDRVIALGGRCLSEPSLKYMASFIAWTACGEATYRWPLQRKVAFRDTTKAMLKRRVRGIQEPVAYVVGLPTTPAKLKAQHPVLYEEAFPEE